MRRRRRRTRRGRAGFPGFVVAGGLRVLPQRSPATGRDRHHPEKRRRRPRSEPDGAVVIGSVFANRVASGPGMDDGEWSRDRRDLAAEREARV